LHTHLIPQRHCPVQMRCRAGIGRGREPSPVKSAYRHVGIARFPVTENPVSGPDLLPSGDDSSGTCVVDKLYPHRPGPRPANEGVSQKPHAKMGERTPLRYLEAPILKGGNLSFVAHSMSMETGSDCWAGRLAALSACWRRAAVPHFAWWWIRRAAQLAAHYICPDIRSP
jgi:hypothetical protein